MQRLDPRSERLLRRLKEEGYGRQVAICGEVFEVRTVRSDDGQVYLYLSMTEAISEELMKDLLDQIVDCQTVKSERIKLTMNDIVPGFGEQKS